MLKVLSLSTNLENAQETFISCVEKIPHELVSTKLGYQSGSFETDVFWFPSLGIWMFLGLPPTNKSEGLRFWNAFGIGYPDQLVSIVCEINPSREGINRRTKGAFVFDEKGQILLCHRGMFNISGGMKLDFFRRNYRGKWIDAEEGNKISRFVKVTELIPTELGGPIRDFVLQVDKIKKLARLNQ
jgi:hypothetical protein